MAAIAERHVSVSPVPAVLPYCFSIILAEKRVLSSKVAAYTAYDDVVFPHSILHRCHKNCSFSN